MSLLPWQVMITNIISRILAILLTLRVMTSVLPLREIITKAFSQAIEEMLVVGIISIHSRTQRWCRQSVAGYTSRTAMSLQGAW